MTIHRDMLPECDVIGMSGTSANVNWGTELAKVWPARFKVLGGRHVTDTMRSRQERFKHPRFFQGFDFIMTGECEKSFVQFCDTLDSLQTYTDLMSIDGCYRVTKDELLTWGAPFPADPDITKLPTPAFDLWEAGFQPGALTTRDSRGKDAGIRQTSTFYKSRGCFYACTFCSDRQTKMREESLEQVEAQCKALVELGVGAVRIADDIFTVKEKRAMAISDILHDYGILFRATTRVNLKNPALFQHLYKKGCSELGFGVEHPSPIILKAMMKGTTPEANDAAIHMAQDAGIAAQAFLIAGFPGETRETLDEMRDWIPRCRPDGVVFSLFQPFPLTTPWETPEKYGVTIPDDCFNHFWQVVGDEDEEPVLDLPTISKAELLSARREIKEVINTQIRHLDRRKVLEDVCQ